MNKIILVVALGFFSGCGVNYSVPANDKNEAKQKIAHANLEQNLIIFKVNGEEVRTTGWTISRFAWGNNNSRISMNITSNMHEDKRTINVNLDGASPGKYPLSQPGGINKISYGSYYPDYTGNQLNNFSFSSGVFEIKEIDTIKNTINGSFYGTVQNLQGDVLEITNGKIINGTLKAGIAYY